MQFRHTHTHMQFHLLATGVQTVAPATRSDSRDTGEIKTRRVYTSRGGTLDSSIGLCIQHASCKYTV